MQNKITDLRNHLFATLESLADSENPMALDRAKAIADVAQTIINSAKVEVDAMAVTKKLTGTSFFQYPSDPSKEAIEHPEKGNRI